MSLEGRSLADLEEADLANLADVGDSEADDLGPEGRQISPATSISGHRDGAAGAAERPAGIYESPAPGGCAAVARGPFASFFDELARGAVAALGAVHAAGVVRSHF